MKRRSSLLALSLFIATVALGQALRPLEVNDLFLIKRLSSPALSPDGRWIAYTLTTTNRKANSYEADLWMVSLDGATTRRLTTDRAGDGNPVWSPDGRFIAFESRRSGRPQIWILPLEGGEPWQFTTLSTGASQAVWAPDGKAIAFVSEVFPEYSELPFARSDSLNAAREKELDGGQVQARVFTRLLYRHWDGWVEGKRRHIFLQAFPSGEPRDLTPGDRDAVPTSSTFSAGTDFAFSPDGREIAFTATPVPIREEAWSTNHDIFILPLGGGPVRQLTTNPAADGYPRYSADGKYIAYRAQRRAGFEADRWELMLCERATGNIRSLTERADISAGSPLWSPQSTALFFPAEDRANESVFSVSVKGNDVRKVIEGQTNQNVLVTPDGQALVFTRMSAVRPPELYSAPVTGGRPRQVTRLNDELFATLDIPAPQSLMYKGADGTPVQTWIYTPPGLDPAKKYPLVVAVHGGPQGAWENGWHYRWNLALWAAQGYVILAPNPRGSTGFGQKFVDEISGDWGGRVFIDLVKGIDFACTLPYVDSTRIAAAGASFGGYMVNWFQAQIPQRFRALITHCGVYNFVSMYGTTDEVWFDEWDHGGTPWEVPERYAKHSPHTYAGAFAAPHLVIHGGRDFRVPFSEAMQLFTALQRRGVPSKMVYFPEESHFVAKPANSEFWHRTVFDWLAGYLGR